MQKWALSEARFLYLCNKKAGDGNRTHVSSLEGWCSTIELHPHKMYEIEYCRAETVVSALMPSSGIEPETRGFSVLCSTN